MAAGKKRTTMAKLNRESKLREKREEKEARKEARKRAAAEGPVEEIGPANDQGQLDDLPPEVQAPLAQVR
jgi:hypothetical protein